MSAQRKDHSQARLAAVLREKLSARIICDSVMRYGAAIDGIDEAAAAILEHWSPILDLACDKAYLRGFTGGWGIGQADDQRAYDRIVTTYEHNIAEASL